MFGIKLTHKYFDKDTRIKYIFDHRLHPCRFCYSKAMIQEYEGQQDVEFLGFIAVEDIDIPPRKE